MGSLVNETKTLQVRLTRKVVRDFIEHDVVPDSNGESQAMANGNASNAGTAKTSKKRLPDSSVLGEHFVSC